MSQQQGNSCLHTVLAGAMASDTLGEQHLTLFLVLPPAVRSPIPIYYKQCSTIAFRDFSSCPFPLSTLYMHLKRGSWKPQDPILASTTRISYSACQSYNQLLGTRIASGFLPNRWLILNLRQQGRDIAVCN